MRKYASIVSHYEDCLTKHGDNHLGVDWPNREDADKRYQVMLDLAAFDPKGQIKAPSILDFGCGAAHLVEFMERKGYPTTGYRGLDLSPSFIALCRRKFPNHSFQQADVLENEMRLAPVDYILMNGVLNEKRALSFEDMLDYTKQLLRKLFPLAGRGIAFNVMSKQVDWERDDLFHLPLDVIADFMTKELSRNFIIRNDYGLYEYTVYLYQQ